MLRLNFVLRDVEGFDCGTELACHYRVPHVRCIVRTRVMCQAGRALAGVGSRGDIVAWLCERAPLWVVVHVCALLRDWVDNRDDDDSGSDATSDDDDSGSDALLWRGR
jgi:hypothetical protein